MSDAYKLDLIKGLLERLLQYILWGGGGAMAPYYIQLSDSIDWVEFLGLLLSLPNNKINKWAFHRGKN